jgi:NADP-dependent 3-hydroxy acid dehydrogenase YdfG
MTQILADTAALVTGASSGIGAATAKALAAQGAVVALLARRADRLQELKTEIESAGGSALVAPVDVTDAEEVSAAARTRADRAIFHDSSFSIDPAMERALSVNAD